LQSRDQKLKFLKLKMAVAAIMKIDFVAITHRRFSDFGEILREEAEWHPDKGHDKNCKLLKSKMADGRYFENR